MNYFDDSFYFMPRQVPPPIGGGNGTASMNKSQGQMMPPMQMVPQQALPQTMPSPSAAALPSLPTGVPGGPLVGPVPSMGAPGMGMGPAPGVSVPATPGGPALTTADPQFVAGYLKTQIGRQVRVEFLIGTTGPLVDRIGTLLGVGVSYILLRPIESDDILMCDLYSIKFVTILL